MAYKSTVVTLTFTLDASGAYAAGDLLADRQVLAGVLPRNGGSAVLQSLTLNDKDDNTAAAMSVVFLDADVSLGTENSAPTITDANADNILGIVPIASGDWADLGGCKVATKTGIGLLVKGATGTTNVYVALITAGSPTQSASGIVGRFAFDSN